MRTTLSGDHVSVLGDGHLCRSASDHFASEALRWGGQGILRKPLAGELRGLKLVDVMRFDMASHIVLLPRITEPALMPDELDQMDRLTSWLWSRVSWVFRGPGSACDGDGGAVLELTNEVEEAMTDIAAIFHWGLRDMDPMTLDELAGGRALTRNPYL